MADGWAMNGKASIHFTGQRKKARTSAREEQEIHTAAGKGRSQQSGSRIRHGPPNPHYLCTYHQGLGEVGLVLVVWVGPMHEHVDVDDQQDDYH